MYYVLDFIPQFGCELLLKCRFWGKKLAEWTSTYYDQSLMTRGRADSYRDDHVDELDSENPPRIYNHPQHRQIVLATST